MSIKIMFLVASSIATSATTSSVSMTSTAIMTIATSSTKSTSTLTKTYFVNTPTGYGVSITTTPVLCTSTVDVLPIADVSSTASVQKTTPTSYPAYRTETAEMKPSIAQETENVYYSSQEDSTASTGLLTAILVALLEIGLL